MKLKPFDILKIIIGVAILAFLLYKVGFESIVLTFSKFNFLYLIPYLIVHFASFFTGAFNLKMLSDRIKEISFRKIFRYNIVAWSFGQFIPAKLGEFSIVYYFKKEGMNFSQALAITIMDKVITTAVVAYIACIGLVKYSSEIFGKSPSLLGFDVTYIFVTVLFASLLLALFILLSSEKIAFTKKYILRGPFKKIHDFIDVVSEFSITQKKILLMNSFVTLIKWLIITIGTLILFMGFGWPVSFVDVLLISAIGTIAGLIPISFAGIREVVTVVLFTRIGVPPEIALSVALLQLVINYATAIAALSMIKIK